jgi:hypothetical protein
VLNVLVGRLGRGLSALQVLLWLTNPVSALDTTLAGRRIDLDAALTLREVIEANRATTHDRSLQQLRIGLAAELLPALRFESSLLAFNGGPTIKAEKSGVYNWHQVFQNRSPVVDFEEFFFDLALGDLDLRIGKQRVSWGKLDRFSPLDVVNAMAYIDPFLVEEAERRLGSPAVHASYWLPEDVLPSQSRFSLLWVPYFIPPRFSDARCEVEAQGSSCDVERWFPPAALPPGVFEIPAGVIPLPGGAGNPRLVVPLGFSTRNDSPGFRLENGSIGAGYSAWVRGADIGVHYFYGFDPQPAFRLTATAFGRPDAGPFNPIGVTDLTATTTLAPVFRRVHVAGGNIAYAISDFTLRAEAAYVHGRPFARDIRDLVSNPLLLAPEIATALGALAQGAGSAGVDLPPSFAVRNAVEWGASVDYLWSGWLLLLQLNQTDVLANSVPLLIQDVETRLYLTVRKAFWKDRFLTQLLGGHGFESDYSFVRPRLAYRLTDHVTVEIGYLAIGGRRSSVIGQYKRNDQGWLRLEFRI